MIDVAAVEKKIRTKYLDLERVADGVFRAVDKHADHQYAVRYFDLTDQLIRTADGLHEYQEEVLSDRYFSGQTATDLRWSHYLYFVTSNAASLSTEFKRAKSKVEADREYARKTVILEGELDSLLTEPPASFQTMPDDLASTWMKRLDEQGLAYVLDEDVSVPEAARLIVEGRKQKAEKIIAPSDLTPAERAAARRFLKSMTITGFRTHPQQRDHTFGRVNLVVGTNGVGKTSLLEAIEYLFCGQTSRPGELMRKTSVSAELVGSGEKLFTSTDTSLQQLRARHSHWYAKSEIKTLTLSKSFGKFNYLDTDAAVHLSVDNSNEQIGPDVTRLLLGSEAEKLSDRLIRVGKKLEEFAKDRERDVVTSEQLLTDSRQRLHALRQVPQASDALFAELNAALKQLDWRELPATKQSAAAVRDGLQLALSATQILARSSVNILASDEKSLLERGAALAAAVESATALTEQNKAATLSLAQADRKQESVRTRLEALDALLPYVEADYAKSAKELKELRKRVESLTTRLSPLGDVDIAVGLQDVLQHSLRAATATAAAVLVEQDKRLAEARRALKALEDTHGTLSVLRQRLLNAVQELLCEVPNPDHCPVCHTDFEAGQLQVRMLAGITDASESQLAELQTVVRSAEQALARGQQRSTDLDRLVAFIGSEIIGTVSEAIETVAQARQTLAAERARLAERVARFLGLSNRGLLEEELTKHLTAAGLSELVEAAELASRKADGKEQLAQEKNAQDSAKKTLETVRSGCEQLASSFGVAINAMPEQLVRELRAQADSLVGAIQASRDLTSLLNTQGKTLEALLVQIEQAQSQLQILTTAVAKEASDLGAETTEAKNIEKLEGRINKAKAERLRLEEAGALLDELIQQGIGGELASKILAENATDIGRTFAAIHMPNEFEIKTVQGKLLIIRRETGKAVKLGEMSTGQRAAYALSLFLAMNSRLKSGPRVLLFDDPIAHVDDMNVLSFLDHLRDLAIKGSRQIFFATADTKLAGLFRQKFRFLGGEDFREIPLTRV
jgi:exonuclease SbcC